jgi:RecA-family ATPase
MDHEHIRANGGFIELPHAGTEAGQADGVKRFQYVGHDAPAARRLRSRKGTDVTLERIAWHWPGRLARGKPTLIAGEPGTGKSTLMCGIAAIYTRGAEWPCGEGRAPKGSVIILSAEDGAADTILPRFAATGGDASKLHIIEATESKDGSSFFSLKTDVEALEAKIEQLADVVCVCIDPISSYLDGTDDHKNGDVRSILGPLGEMAERTGVALLAITHFAKSGSTSKAQARHRVIGSTAFIAWARLAFSVIEDAEDDARRLLLHLKNNLAAPPKGLAYRLEQRLAGTVDGEMLYASAAAFEAEHVAETADQAIAAHDDKLRGGARKKSPEREDAEAFLRAFLADGPQFSKDVTDAARKAGVSDKALRKAREDLVDSVQDRSADRRVISGFMWRLKSNTTPGGNASGAT